MVASTFKELFCAGQKIEPEAYAAAVFARTLYPHARPWVPLFRTLNSNYFAADMDLIRATGTLRRCRDFPDEVLDFNHHPANQGFYRQTLRIRVSAKRLKALLRETLPRGEKGDDGSNSPFLPTP